MPDRFLMWRKEAKGHYTLCVTAVLQGLILIWLVGCQTAPPLPVPVTPTLSPVILRIGVVDTAVAFTDLVATPYAQHTDRAILQFIPGSTATLFADLDAGQLDAILVHHIPESETIWFNPVAIDGLVVIIHPDNPVTSLSRGDVQAMFNGRITNWSAFGEWDRPITLVSRERGAGMRAIFLQRVMGEQRISINAMMAANQTIMDDTIAADPGAIGYSMMGMITQGKPIAIDGLLATRETVGSQQYPLTAPLYFVSTAEPQQELRAWLSWLQSTEGQGIIGARYGRVR